MNSTSDLQEIADVGNYVYFVNILLTILFNIGWIVQCLRECVKVAMKYRICKRTPNLHPIYRDVQYLSQHRKLYNLKTHFVKYVLMVMCLSVELCVIFWFVLFIWSCSRPLTANLNNEQKNFQSKYPNCNFSKTFAHLIFFPFYILMYTFIYFLFFLLFVLLSILNRYLAARYLNHSFKRTLLKYIFWLAVQFVLILLCSTIYTLLISVLLFPLLFLINWLVLFRDNRILCRVLRSNLREIKLHSSNKVLYREQLSAYSFYRIFQKTLLISLFFLVILMTLHNLYYGFKFTANSLCLLNFVVGGNHNIPNIILFQSLYLNIHSYEPIVESILLLLYSFSTSLPIMCVTIIPLVRVCVNRYRSRHNVYRYSYESIKQPLL